MSYKQPLYNEEELSKYIYENGFTDGEYDRREAFLVSKYMRHVLGYKDAHLKKRLIEFCKADRLFNEVLENNFIKDCVNQSKRQFVVRESLSITSNELLKIRTIKNFKAQKTYIGLLAIAKKNGYDYVSVKDYPFLKRIVGIGSETDELYNNLHLLFRLKFIYPIDKTDKGAQRLLVIERDGVPDIIINKNSEINHLGKLYEEYCGGYLLYCEDCGVEFIRNGKSQKYCEFHSTERERNRKR